MRSNPIDAVRTQALWATLITQAIWDTCIALRTIVFTDNKIFIQAGAGIVADSVPAVEYQETLNKAGAMLKAIESTVARTSSSNN